MSVYIRDPAAVERKREAMVQDGIHKLHIIADFDGTLTHLNKDGQRVPTSMSVIRDKGHLHPGYVAEAKALAAEYMPVEYSDAPHAVKVQRMEEWWQKHLVIMIKYGMSRETVEHVISNHQLPLRPGAADLLRITHEHGIPFLIFSAGLGDIIVGCLQQEGRLHKNTRVVSNFYDYDEQGKVRGYKAETIHVYTKNEQAVRGTPYAEEIRERRNVILLGDRPGDLSMAQGFRHDTQLSIGFLNGHHELLETFDGYDIVVLEDGDLSVVLELLEQLIAGNTGNL